VCVHEMFDFMVSLSFVVACVIVIGDVHVEVAHDEDFVDVMCVYKVVEVVC